MDVSVIIVNYNTYALTSACIRSVLQFTQGIKYEIILVDNNSTEAEPITYEQLFHTLKVIRLPANLGFAKGNNAGLSVATGKYSLLLNSDTVLKENSIKLSFDYLEENERIGVISARLIYPDGTHQSVAQRFPAAKYQLAEFFRVQKLLTRQLGGKLLLGAFFDHKSNIPVDWVWGAYFMFRREILQKLPGNKLDDVFFMYMEDMQWCKDIKKLGYEIHFFAGTEVIHLLGGSSGAKNNLMEQNGRLFLKRNYSLLHRYLIKQLSKVLNR